MQDIKHQFLAFRNGIVADTLRKAGMPYPVIFGLQIPQIAQIAREAEASRRPLLPLAERLWADRNVRESRLLACYLFPPGEIDTDKALSLASDVITHEEADILCFRLLRRLPFAESLLNLLPSDAYVTTALRRNLS